MSEGKRRVALGMIVSPMDLMELVREQVVQSLPERIAAVWREQNPQKEMPNKATDALKLKVDLAVVTDMIEDLTVAIVRRLELAQIEIDP